MGSEVNQDDAYQDNSLLRNDSVIGSQYNTDVARQRNGSQFRTTACTVGALLTLIPLWSMALSAESDSEAITLCLVVTVFLVGWINYKHEQEHERTMGDDLDDGMELEDLLSHQERIALASLDFQRSISGPTKTKKRGVRKAAKAQWQRVLCRCDGTIISTPRCRGLHEVVETEGISKPNQLTIEDCSICLVEYKVGESLMRLPCVSVHEVDLFFVAPLYSQSHFFLCFVYSRTSTMNDASIPGV